MDFSPEVKPVFCFVFISFKMFLTHLSSLQLKVTNNSTKNIWYKNILLKKLKKQNSGPGIGCSSKEIIWTNVFQN